MHIFHPAYEIKHYLRRSYKHVGIKYLRADVAVESAELYRVKPHSVNAELLRLSRLNSRAELRVDLSRRDRCVGVRIDTGRQTQKNALSHPARRRDPRNSVKLLNIINDEVADTVIHRVFNIRVGLVVTVEIGTLHRESRRHGSVYLARGNHVDAHTERLHYSVYFLVGCRLAGVERHSLLAEGFAHSLKIDPTVFSYFVAVGQIERSAVFFSQLDGVSARKGQMPRVVHR